MLNSKKNLNCELVFYLHHHNLFQVAYYIHIEDIDRQIIFLTHGRCRKIHYFQSLLCISHHKDIFKFGGCRVLFRSAV